MKIKRFNGMKFQNNFFIIKVINSIDLLSNAGKDG